MPHSFSLDVDGVNHATSDRTLDGRQVRTIANLTPTSEYVLIRVDGGFARSIGLEEEVTLEPGQLARFRSFRSDQILTLTMDERGWEWGAGMIGDADIRAIAGIPDDHELFLDSDHDAAIERGALVALEGGGVERVRSRKALPQKVRIVLNGRMREVDPGEIRFEQLVALAFPVPPAGQNVSLTVSYRKGPPSRPEGSLLPGQSVHVIDGMTFNVTATDKS
ncbi:multiubiquitin domain-containing protein [Sphingomonas sp. UYP23]